MNWLDRVLLIILVLMLPLVVVGTYFFLGDNKSEDDSLKALDAAKFEQLVNQVQTNQMAQAPVTPKPFYLASVSYASESGVLSVSGTAPQTKTTVLVTATVLPRDYDVAELEEGETIKGTSVETFSTLPVDSGKFEFFYEIDKKRSEDIVELRLEQDNSIKTIRFDLKERKQVF